MSRLLVICCLWFCSVNASIAMTTEQPFTQQTLSQLKIKYADKNWLILLWSIDCPPCFKELAMLQRLSANYGHLPLVIINTDGDSSLTDERREVISEFKLDTLDNYYFVEGQVEVSRNQVDPNWFGELPRSYFVSKSGLLRGKSGLIKESHIKQWLVL